MGKKNKKSRRYDDDDILGPPPPQPDGDDAVANADVGEPAETVAEAEGDPPPAPKAKKEKEKANVKIDIVTLEETMADILRNYGGDYQSEDWLHRTIEKNMCLPKRSLMRGLEPHVLDEMLEQILGDVRRALDRERDEDLDREQRWESFVAGLCEKESKFLSGDDEARLREEARGVGLDPEAAVARVTETIRAKFAKDAGQKDGVKTMQKGDGGQEKQPDGSDASISVSILLALQPYIQQPALSHSSSGNLFEMMRRFLCLLLHAVFSLVLGEQARLQAKRTWEKIHLPSIKAAQLAREREGDDRMLRENTHLWSNQEQRWIERDCTYLPPPGEMPDALPATIRWNNARGQWERWSKNLTTRTKATKKAASTGTSVAFTRGAFVPVRAGEGWATAPEQPETEKEQIVGGGICFFACLPSMDDENPLEVVDVTSWATKTLVTKVTALELGAVDSGKELFSLEVTTTLLLDGRGGKKKKGGKTMKQKKWSGKDEGDDLVARKGIGCTAMISKKYSDQS